MIVRLSSSDAATLVAAFEADYFGDGVNAGFAVIEAAIPLLDSAARLVAVH